MKFSHIFIRRPIFAAVIAIFIVIVGGLAYMRLPVAQFPEVAPPTVTVTATYPGANAQIASDTVATPIEQEINGVENMIYMSSQSTADGTVTITVTFELGTTSIWRRFSSRTASPSRSLAFRRRCARPAWS